MGYPGGKNGAGVYQSIINRMPPHSVYIEPFLGGGAVLRLKRPAALNIGLDLDAIALRQFRRGWPGSPRVAMNPDLEASPKMANGAGGQGPSPETPGLPASLETARPAIGGLVGESGAAGPGGIARNGAAVRIVGSVDAGLRARAGAPVFCFERRDAFEFLRTYPFQGGELVYCDPPYMHETRGRANLYRYELDDAKHVELLGLLRILPCRVMLSGYFTPLYARHLRAWHSFAFQTVNRAGARTTEWVWCNFPEPLELHDYRYLGRNFRERERIKRKKTRWVARLRGMAVLERRALLDAIRESWGGGLDLASPAPASGSGIAAPGELGRPRAGIAGAGERAHQSAAIAAAGERRRRQAAAIVGPGERIQN